MPDDHITGTKFIPAKLGLRNIDVFRPHPVVLAQEADTFIHDLKDTTANFKTFRFADCPGEFQDQGFLLLRIGRGNPISVAIDRSSVNVFFSKPKISITLLFSSC